MSMYHQKLQGFVYGLLRDSGFEIMHDKMGYKFYATKLKDYVLFEQFKYRCATATKAVIDGGEYVLVGSMWEFVWSFMDETQRRVIEFGLDTGFGERNSLGFGFVNKISF